MVILSLNSYGTLFGLYESKALKNRNFLKQRNWLRHPDRIFWVHSHPGKRRKEKRHEKVLPIF